MRALNLIRVKYLLVFAVAMLILASIFAVNGAASAQEFNVTQALCAGANLENPNNIGASSCTTGGGASASFQIDALIQNIISLLSWGIGLIAVFMIIVGGFKYITSGGESTGVTAAKNTILYAIIGLVIVALSQVIVRFILGRISTIGVY